MADTQRDTVLAMLRAAGPSGVCGTRFLAAYIPRYAARVLELRQTGHTITTRTCQNLYHEHESRQTVYVLEDIEPGTQTALEL